MFFSKKQNFNEVYRNKMLGSLDECIRNCGNAELATQLQNARNSLNNMGESHSSLIQYDASIIRYLSQIAADISNQSYRVAQIRMDLVTKLISERKTQTMSGPGTLAAKSELRAARLADKQLKKYEKKNPIEVAQALTVDDLYNAEDMYAIQVASLQDALDKCSNDMKTLQTKFRANPRDNALANRINVLAQKMQGLQEQQSLYMDENVRNAYIQSMKNAPATNKQILAERPNSPEAEKLIMQEYDVFKQNRGNDAVLEHMKNSQQGASQSFSAGTNVGAGASIGGFSAAPGFGAASANSIIDEVMREAEIEESKKKVKDLERAIEKIQDDMDTVNDDRNDVIRELKPLLERRKTATIADRQALDAKIDSLNSRLGSFTNKLKRLEQQQAEYNDKLSVLRDSLQQSEINAQSEKLVGNIDVSDIAMRVNEETKRKNAELESAHDAVAVAQAEDIITGSMSGTNSANSNVDATHGDDKYADLEALLGLSESQQ